MNEFKIKIEGPKYGVGFGAALAMTISFNTHHSIVWAIVHGVLNWFYVIYFALTR